MPIFIILVSDWGATIVYIEMNKFLEYGLKSLDWEITN